MKDNPRFNVNGFLTFSFIAFWPVVFFIIFYGSASLLSILLAPTELSDTLQLIACIGFMVMVMFFSFKLCQKASWKKRGVIIYIGWIILALEISFLFIAAIGGASMAVVDGKTPLSTRYGLYFLMAVSSTFWMHIFIVPWTFVSLRLLKKLGQDKVFIPGAQQPQ